MDPRTITVGLLAAFAIPSFTAAHVVSLPRPSASGPTTTTGRPVAQLRAKVSAHVYVLDSLAGHVSRFPIVDGLVQSQPDASLNVPTGSSGFALDAEGKQYVSYTAGQRINVYARGAKNADPPERFITIDSSCEPAESAVDGRHYIFVVMLCSHGPTGVTVISPRGKVSEISTAFVSSIALDPQGSLYVETTTDLVHPVIDVYTTPETHPKLARSPCFKRADVGFAGIAVSTQNTLFVGGNHEIDVIKDTDNSCPVSGHRLISTVNPQLSHPTLAISGDQVFALERSAQVLLQLDAREDRQTPVATVPVAGNPVAVAVGP